MRGGKIAWILAAFALLASVVAASAKGDPRLVGHWYGEGQQAHGQYSQWIIEYRANETFSIVFRMFADKGCDIVEDQAESGVWQLNPPRLVLITTRVKGAATDITSGFYRDTYRVTRLDGGRYVIVHEGYDVTFSSRRVGRDFTFPSKSGCPSGPRSNISFEWRTRVSERRTLSR